MTIAKRVRDLRYAKGWGPDELANRAEISRTALYQIECGKTETPRAGTLKRIARALDVTIESLLASESGGSIDLSSMMSDHDEDYEEPRNGNGHGNGHGSHEAHPANGNSSFELAPRLHPAREADLHRKFHELLASPLGEGIARIIEESYKVLPQGRHR